MDATQDRNHIIAIGPKRHRAAIRNQDAIATIPAAFQMRVMWIVLVAAVTALSMSEVQFE
jgi:hypothetical protein